MIFEEREWKGSAAQAATKRNSCTNMIDKSGFMC